MQRWWLSGQRDRLLSDPPSSNPGEVYCLYSVNCLERTKINKKRPGMDHPSMTGNTSEPLSTN